MESICAIGLRNRSYVVEYQSRGGFLLRDQDGKETRSQDLSALDREVFALEHDRHFSRLRTGGRVMLWTLRNRTKAAAIAAATAAAGAGLYFI